MNAVLRLEQKFDERFEKLNERFQKKELHLESSRRYRSSAGAMIARPGAARQSLS